MICVPNTDSVGVLSSPVSDQEATHHPVGRHDDTLSYHLSAAAVACSI